MSFRGRERVNLLLASVSLLGFFPRLGLNAAGAIPGEKDIVDPLTLVSADGPVVPDDDDPETPMIPCDDVDPADAPVIQGQ